MGFGCSSTIPHVSWFQWQSNHLLIRKRLKDFVLFVLWDTGLPARVSYSLFLGFPISIANYSNRAIKSSFYRSLRKFVK
jgi:hypothetical protein